MNPIGDFPVFPLSPFIKSIGWNQASSGFERTSKTWFLLDDFCSGVDQQGLGLGVLDPGRNQAPAHGFHHPYPIKGNDHRQRLGRSDIVSLHVISFKRLGLKVRDDRV